MAGVDRRFCALVCAYAVSGYGNYLNLIALSLFSYQVTGTAFGVGVVMALRLASGFVAGLTAAALSARTTRLRTMVRADVAQGLAMAVLAVCADRTPLWLLCCVVVVMGAGNTYFTVALRSAVPAMVGHEARTRANGLLVTARSIATVLGFASAAAVIGFGGYATAFAVNAVSFAVSAGALLALRPRTEGEDQPEPSGDQPVGDGPARDRAVRDEPVGDRPVQDEPLRDGPVRGEGGRRRKGAVRPRGPRPWQGVAGLPALLLGMILLRGLDALASSSHNVALPVVAHADAPSDPALFMTRFWAAWAVGTVAAHLVLKRAGGAAAWGERAFALGTLAMSVCFVAAFTGLPAAGLMAAAACAGFADGWTEIVYTSRLQAALDRERSRLFGLSATAETAGFALGTVLAAAALEALPALTVVGMFHGAAVCGALVLLLCAAVRTGAGRRRSSTSGEEGDTDGTRTGTGALPGA
ncbi:MFS transporter [Streptomyces thermolilacinus]|uniref:MFS transporter n=1 Tax=Streptomyces thermolilacinus SPC6 TaxID=1306406 RepID=A0A1D3DNM9_9ACTN|nr:MFS transporter [Streptomyces thermolilacinus]OEJ93930.1 MFS transporter [Streptomyces thermolilacinus SPC6]